MEESAILLIFFNRPQWLKQTFFELAKFKPKKLYLFHDGPRENNDDDISNIKKCEEIVSKINWNCEVHRNYQKNNLGCGFGPFTAINWAFKSEEKLIILEDDCVPSQSFFDFCNTMLDYYEKSDRVFLISGSNLEVQTKIEESFFFAYAGTNCGWATWKKNWLLFDFKCDWVNDKFIFKKVGQTIRRINKRAAVVELKSFKKTNKLLSRNQQLSYWDEQWQATRYIHNMLSIVPSKNLITNIGLGFESTHAKKSSIPEHNHNTPGKINFCFNERYELNVPYVFPNNITENRDYDKKVYNSLYKNFFHRVLDRTMKILKRRHK